MNEIQRIEQVFFSKAEPSLTEKLEKGAFATPAHQPFLHSLKGIFVSNKCDRRFNDNAFARIRPITIPRSSANQLSRDIYRTNYGQHSSHHKSQSLRLPGNMIREWSASSPCSAGPECIRYPNNDHHCVCWCPSTKRCWDISSHSDDDKVRHALFLPFLYINGFWNVCICAYQT